MSPRKKNPIVGYAPILNVNVNAADLQDVVCQKCQGRIFQYGATMKKISALQSPNGRPEYLYRKVTFCIACREPVPEVPVFFGEE